MLVVLSLMACSGGEAESPPPVLPPDPTLEAGPLPEPRRGVDEVVTPREVQRAADVQDRGATSHLDIWFDPDATTFEALGARLETWGFAVLDGDGESWRVSTPPGAEWPERLLPLPEIAKVTESVELIALESGAFREGSERYGSLTHTWSWREGGPVERVAGAAKPAPPLLPRSLPASVVRCLAPARTEITAGVSIGVGWERAYVAEPPTWVLVLQGYGACDASGWLPLRPDASTDGLRVGGRAVGELDGAGAARLAADYLRTPRPYQDPSALAAWDILRPAPTETLERALSTTAPGAFQERIWEELDERDHAAALLLAERSTSPAVRAKATAEVDTLRTGALQTAGAPADAVWAALTVWRPGPADPPELLERLRSHPSPRIRAKAWELSIEQSAEACSARAQALEPATVTSASAVYRECPQQTTRVAAFNQVAKLDPVAAAAMVRVVLEEPETVATGILAVRHAAALERYDLLEAVVARPTLAREMRRLALDLLVKGEAAGVADLIEQHGVYLGYRPSPGAMRGPATADGEP